MLLWHQRAWQESSLRKVVIYWH